MYLYQDTVGNSLMSNSVMVSPDFIRRLHLLNKRGAELSIEHHLVAS